MSIFYPNFSKLTDENIVLTRKLEEATNKILTFPRRQEKIILDTEKRMRLKSEKYRQEDAKMRA